MSIITLFPYEGIKLWNKYIPFEATWQAVQEILGKPEHRYMDFGPEDSDDIVDDNGYYKNDYRNEAPIKEDFFEERNEVKFVYRNNCLCSIEPIGEYSIIYGDIVFNSNGIDECEMCKKKYTVKEYKKGHKFAVKELGLVGSCRANLGLYQLCSKNEFDSKLEIRDILEKF